jgi:hypothetical protein
MAEPGMARGKQVGPEPFQMKPLGIFTTSSTNKLQTKFEDDDDEYENDVGRTGTIPSALATQTRMV